MLEPKISKDANGRWVAEWTPDDTGEGYGWTTDLGQGRTFNPDVSRISLGTRPEGTTPTFKVHVIDMTNRADEVAPDPNEPPPPPPPDPDPSGLPRYGYSTGAIALSWGATDRNFCLAELKKTANGKPFAVRFDMSDSANFYALVDGCLANGLTPYIVSYGTTGPRSLDGLPAKIANRYKGKNIIFTGPNEPDLHGWQPNQLADFQVALYNAIKAVDQNIMVGGPAIWKGGSGIPAYATALAVRAKNKFQFQPFHGYDDPTVHATWCIWDHIFPGGSISAATTLKEIYKANGITVPIISDECGSKATGQGQADYHKKLLDQSKNDRSQATFIFSLLPDYDGGWQTIDSNKVERVSFTNYVNYMKAV